MVAKANPKLVFFTDLDGTLLDHDSYCWDAAQPALSALRRRSIPLVIVTSKTRAEVLNVLRALRRREPFVVENGGAIYFPARYFPFKVEGSESAGGGWRRLVLGAPRLRLVSALATAARGARARVRGFSQMSTREAAQRTGLRPAEAQRALRREYDEPFLILVGEPKAWPRLRREITRWELKATRGSRFFHILGMSDKGAAVQRLIGLFNRVCGSSLRTVGLGDSPNDIAFLGEVDIPILVARPDGYDAETLAAVPRVRRAGGVGPAGWNRAVLKLLQKTEC